MMEAERYRSKDVHIYHLLIHPQSPSFSKDYMNKLQHKIEIVVRFEDFVRQLSEDFDRDKKYFKAKNHFYHSLHTDGVRHILNQLRLYFGRPEQDLREKIKNDFSRLPLEDFKKLAMLYNEFLYIVAVSQKWIVANFNNNYPIKLIPHSSYLDLISSKKIYDFNDTLVPIPSENTTRGSKLYKFTFLNLYSINLDSVYDKEVSVRSNVFDDYDSQANYNIRSLQHKMIENNPKFIYCRELLDYAHNLVKLHEINLEVLYPAMEGGNAVELYTPYLFQEGSYIIGTELERP